MKKEIRVPPAGESVNEVTIGRLLKPSGTFVEENDEICELETEKVNQVIYASAQGVLTWQVEEGESCTIDQVIGFVEVKKKEETPSPKKEERAPPKEEVSKVPSREEKSVPREEEKPVMDVAKNETRKKMTKIRKVIASRLVESLHTSAMLTTFNEVDMSSVLEYREKNKEAFLQKHGIKLGMTSFFVVAVLEALKAFPLLNSYIDGDEIVERNYYNIGVAVSSERGLVVPVLKQCDQCTFPEIEKKIADFAQKARSLGLKIEDLEGGGFTISNGGVFGSLLSTPILNPPQVGILGLHKIEKRAVVIEDKIVIRPMMYLALSYDHRIIDGKDAILFLIKVKEVLENLNNFWTKGT